MTVLFNSNSTDSNRLGNNSNWLSNRDELSGMAITVVGLGLVESTLLPGNLSLDWVTDFSGDRCTLLTWNSDGDWEWDSSALGDWLGVALSLWNRSGDSVTGGDWLGNTLCVWDSSGDCGAFLS